jgi:polar amino acid transport system substrate-binding protein
VNVLRRPACHQDRRCSPIAARPCTNGERRPCRDAAASVPETAFMQRRTALACLTSTLLALAAAAPAQAQSALDEIMAKKLVKIAVPTDFPPYGFVGPDLKPMGLDVDMANYIAAKLGAKIELVPVTSANRIPYLQTKKADLVISTLGKNAEREKVIDFTAAYSPFFQAVFAAKTLTVKSAADLAGKSVGVTRGAIEDMELTKIAPATADIKRFEDNNATVSAFVAGQVQTVATGASVADNMIRRNPQLNAEYKFLLKDSPNFIGVAKGDDKLRMKVNEIIAAAKKAGDLDKMAQKWLGRPAGELP